VSTGRGTFPTGGHCEDAAVRGLKEDPVKNRSGFEREATYNKPNESNEKTIIYILIIIKI